MASTDCSLACRRDDGTATTCGDEKACQTCARACSATASCGASCLDDSMVTTCEELGECQRWDTYCAYPVIASAGVSDTHEFGFPTPWGWDSTAYMYFESAGYPKSGTYPGELGGVTFDPSDAWASNFRGSKEITGETSRTQWEWTGGGLHGGFYPYVYGKTCEPVPTGSHRPTLTVKHDEIWEDDECFMGLCNPDDFVGSFDMAREFCATDVFARGETSGWSEVHSATTAGSLTELMYRLWCYSCIDTPGRTCQP
ncbi:MAG: hypothetical protein AB7T06_19005 [Kofleriaceae bacterium]